MPWYQLPLVQIPLIAYALLGWVCVFVNLTLASKKGLNRVEWAFWGYLFPLISTYRLAKKP